MIDHLHRKNFYILIMTFAKFPTELHRLYAHIYITDQPLAEKGQNVL